MVWHAVFPAAFPALVLLATLGTLRSESAAAAPAFEMRGAAGLEGRGFAQSGAAPGQGSGDVSVRLAPEFHATWADGRAHAVFSPFYRQDGGDRERTHFDLRELALEYASADWEARVGVRKVFWGVAESNHLVDVINQTDAIENPDQEDKLGQPMLNLAYVRPWGTLDAYILPWFRERTFPGRHGRLRTGLVVDTALTRYESPAAEHHVDFALRYAYNGSGFDVGLSQFRGTSREPLLVPARDPGGRRVLAADYRQIDQTGLDAQFALESWLFKLEALHRTGLGKGYAAVVGGFEYTQVGVAGSACDLGWLLELHWDQRGKEATTVFNHDVFAGLRLALNDAAGSSVLAGVVTDTSHGGVFGNVEAERRLGDRWRAELQLRVFASGERADVLQVVERDSYLGLSLDRYF